MADHRISRPSARVNRPIEFLAALAMLLAGCRQENVPPPASPPAATAVATRAGSVVALPPLPRKEPVPEAPTIRFRDATAGSGIDFVLCSGNSPEKYSPTANGSGVALLDYDGDGLLDVYLATTRNLPMDAPTTSRGNRLYRNRGGGKFEDVTEQARVGFRGFTHGLAAGDLDNNGFPDLYLANFGQDVVFLNNGNGTFRRVDVDSRVKPPAWPGAAALIDYDGDGDLDVYVATYGRWTFEGPHPYTGDAGRKIKMYDVPSAFPSDRHYLLRNRGDGTFEDVTAAAGILRSDGRGLGVVAVDIDRDGHVDLFVGNDGTANFLFRNRGDGTFEDISTTSGASANEAGYFQAGMGVAAEDVNGDGLPELFLTTFRSESDVLYQNLDGAHFLDVSARAGIVKESMPEVGWGCALADFDNDGWPDLFVANGHVDDNLTELGKDDTTWAEISKVYRNLGGGRFRRVAEPGPFFARPHVARGAAFGDLDNDGDLDAVVNLMDERATLLLNESAPRPWIGLDLVGRRGSRPVVGALVAVHAGGRVIHRQVKGGGSYMSSNDPRLLIGLGSAERVDRVEIRWPDGARTELAGPDLQTHRYHLVRQPSAPGRGPAP